MVHCTSRYYPMGISKSSIRPCGPTYVLVLFVECMSGGPPTYVSA
jgi:hypothetical protein